MIMRLQYLDDKTRENLGAWNILISEISSVTALNEYKYNEGFKCHDIHKCRITMKNGESRIVPFMVGEIMEDWCDHLFKRERSER